jgi:hypothetical protein
MGVSHDSGRTDACFLLLRERILSIARQASSPVHMDIMLPGWRVVLIFLPAFLFSHYVVYLDWCCAACSAYVQAQTNSTHVMF